MFTLNTIFTSDTVLTYPSLIKCNLRRLTVETEKTEDENIETSMYHYRWPFYVFPLITYSLYGQRSTEA